MNTHATKLIFTAFLAGLLALSVVPAAGAQEVEKSPEPSVDDVIARYLEAIGGLEANESLKTRRVEGTLTLTAVGAPWKLTTIQKAPDKSHTRIEIPGYGDVTEGCDGRVAWKSEPGQGTRQFEGWELQSKLRDARFDWITEMLTDGELTYEGLEDVDGEAVHVLNATYPGDHPGSDAAYTLYIDEMTHLVRVLEIAPHSTPEAEPSAVEMSDYRVIDGVQIPFAMTVSVGPNPVMSIAFEKVTHDIEVDDALFAMPAPDLAAVDYTPLARDDWPVSTPAEQGLEPNLVAGLYSDAAGLSKLCGLLVVKNGHLIAEGYFHEGAVDSLALVQSVSKSYNSALIGLALDRGCLSSVDQTMLEFFPELADEITDPRKHEITIRQMLQMRAGYPWEESDPALWDVFVEGDYMPLIEGFPLVNDPGAEFHYSNFTSWLLGVIVARACDTDLKSFAYRHLFAPMDADAGEWYEDPYGYYYSLFSFTARDMARFGQLYLDGGVYEGKQVIPAEWVTASLQSYTQDAHITDTVGRYLGDIGYGYQWWSATVDDRRFDFAWGHGGQLIVLLDELDMIIVVTSYPFFLEHNSESWTHEVANIDLVGKFISSLPKE